MTMTEAPLFAKELASLEKGWQQAGISRLVNAEQRATARRLVMQADSSELAQLPSHLRIEQEAFSNGMIQEAGALELIRDPLEYSAQLKAQMRLINDAFSETFVQARSDNLDPAELCSLWLELVQGWVTHGHCAPTPSMRDIDRIGALIGNSQVRARLAVSWLSTLTLVRCVFAPTSRSAAQATARSV